MLNQVKTVVINKSRTPFRLAYSRGKTATFQPGKEQTFDFDLMSTLDRTAKNALQTAVNRGILVVTTKIISEGTMITIAGKDIQLSPYVPPAPKEAAPIKKKEKSAGVSAELPTDNYIGGRSGGVAGRSEERFKAAFGVHTESQMESLVEDVVVPANGKLEKKASVVPLKKVNTNAEDTVSVFKSEVADKEAIAEPEQEPAETETKAVNAADIDEQLEITKYLGEKDYNIVYAWLEEHYKDVFPKKLTKAAVKKCRTYEELMEAIERVKAVLDE